MPTALVWFRRDLRLDDNPALQAALDAGYAPIPVYVHAPAEEAPWSPGAASNAWLERSLRSLADDLAARGSRLLLRHGPTLSALDTLATEAGAEAVFWNRLYDPALIARDRTLKQALAQRGLHAQSFNAALLAEPWTVTTNAGDPCRVFTPFWKKVRPRLDDVAPTIAAPARLPPVDAALSSEPSSSFALAASPPWDTAFWTEWTPGEAGAHARLEAFVATALAGYDTDRDRPDREGTSRLSPHLHFGEVSPRAALARIVAADAPAQARERALAELGWREFAHHVLYHFPHSTDADFNARFAGFDWVAPDARVLRAWHAGRTGVPIVDAGLRQLWATGWMHNRVRMIVASFLCKNLRLHWTHGARWFWDTLVDADLANDTLGWQWSAGTGSDAAPYFRIFNPVTQARRFDPDGAYVRRWVPELAVLPTKAIFAPWEHRAEQTGDARDYPERPIVDLAASRDAALHAFKALRAPVAEPADA